MKMWIEKHKPERVSEIAGQAKAVDEALKWLSSWKPGSKALFLYGPPGTGKTLLAETLAKERGWMLVRVNASDRRSAEEIERVLGEASKSESLFHAGKLILIDEVDGITGGERGAVQAIIRVIKESRFPVILIANDPWKPKLLQLRSYTNMVRFHKVPAPSIEKRLREICGKEGISCEGNVLKTLARFSQGDMRSAIYDLQLVAEGRESISEKDLESVGFRDRESAIFNVLPTILRSGNINAARKAIREIDKDPDEVFLWIENNLPLVVRDREKLAKAFDLLSRADIIRSRVSTQQNWRFRLIMTDLMACVSLFRDERSPGFVPFQPPQRIAILGRSKAARAEREAMVAELAERTHCSKRIAKREYLPYLRIIAKGK